MKTISYKMLATRKACQSQLDKFEKKFGLKPVKVNRQNLRRAVKAGLDVTWVLSFVPEGLRLKAEDRMARFEAGRSLNHTKKLADGTCVGCAEFEQVMVKEVARALQGARRLRASRG